MGEKDRVGEQGFAHLLVVAIAVVVLAGIGFVGWSVMNHHKPGATTGNSAATTSAYSSCMKAYSDGRLCQFAAHYTPISKVAYQATINVTSPQGTLSALTFASDGKGNTSLVGTSEGVQVSTIDFNGATYIKTSNSGWIEYPAGATNAPAQTDPVANMNIGVGTSGLGFQYAGTASCGSLTCYKYQVIDHGAPNTTQYMWFDTSTYLLRQWSYQGVTGSTNMTLTYQPVTIAAPSPVQVI
jgi:hypothetical protein